MRRLTALLGKELRQHAAVGLALLVCLVAAYLLLLLGTVFGDETVSLMEAHAAFLPFVTLGGLVLGNRLIVAEYYGRTQLFVEALPLCRREMVAVKYLLGLGLLLLAAGLSLLATAAVALTREPIDARFLAIVLARTGAYVFFIWSFFFVMGFVGRFRVAIYIAIVLALVFVDELTAFEISRFAPLAVLDNTTLPFEREIMPLRAVLETLILGAGMTALAFVLALINEGSLAEVLARRMSQREKAVIGILFVGLMLAFAVLEERRDKPPYAFPEQQVVRGEALPIEILYLLDQRRSDAEALLDRLENDLGALATELAWVSLPAVRVAYAPSLDPGIYDQAELEENDGILLRANFKSAADKAPVDRSALGWQADDFSAHVVGLVLDEATGGRARFEPKAWLRDAFAQWWSMRGWSMRGWSMRGSAHDSSTAVADTDLETELEDACRQAFAPLLRALWVTAGEPLSEDRLAVWRRYRERHGEDLAQAVALSGLLVLERAQGRDAVLSLARQVFGRRPRQDLRELIYEWRHPMATVFEQATGLDWSGYVAHWNVELERLRAAPACRRGLAAVPRGEASIEIENGGGSVRDVVYSVRFAEPSSPGQAGDTPPEGTLVTLLHERLTAFDSELERRDLRRVEKLWPAASRRESWRLSGFYSRGSRVFLALEVESAALGCAIRLHAERRQLR